MTNEKGYGSRQRTHVANRTANAKAEERKEERGHRRLPIPKPTIESTRSTSHTLMSKRFPPRPGDTNVLRGAAGADPNWRPLQLLLGLVRQRDVCTWRPWGRDIASSFVIIRGRPTRHHTRFPLSCVSLSPLSPLGPRTA